MRTLLATSLLLPLIACGPGQTARPTQPAPAGPPDPPAEPEPEKPPEPPIARSVADLIGADIASITIIDGGRHTSAIRAAITSAVGSPLSGYRIDADIRAIWQTKTVDKVRVSGVLVADKRVALRYHVTTRPVIAQIRFRGNSALTEAALRSGSRLQPGTLLSMSRAYSERNRLVELYGDIGHRASVTVKTIRSADEVAVVFEIAEGPAYRIATIDLPGVPKRRAAQLRALLADKSGKNTAGGFYSAHLLEGGLRRMTLWYYDHGHVNIKVGPPTLDFDAKAASMKIRISISEGPAFRYGKLGVKGNLLAPMRTYLRMSKARRGKIFNRSQIQAWIKAIEALHTKRGKPAPSVTPISNIDVRKRIVDLTLSIE